MHDHNAGPVTNPSTANSSPTTSLSTAPDAPSSTNSIQPGRDLEASLSTLLTVGTAMSAGVTLVGIALYLVRHSGERLDFSAFGRHEAALNAPVTIATRAAALDPAAIMQLGVLLLILTPIVRVGFTLVAFLTRRDWMYVAIAAIVLVVLGLGLVGIRMH